MGQVLEYRQGWVGTGGQPGAATSRVQERASMPCQSWKADRQNTTTEF